MQKNLFPTILISVLLAFWGMVLFGYNYSEAIVINKANTNSRSTLQNGLVQWWTFDGKTVSGNQLTDASDGPGHGSGSFDFRGAKIALGKLGQGILIHADPEEPTVTIQTPTINTSTIAFWYKTNTTTLPNGHRMIISTLNVAETYVSLADIGGSAVPFFSGNIGGAQQTLSSGVNSKVGKWTHVAVTWDGSFIKIYVDGVFRNTSANVSGIDGLQGFDSGEGYIGKWSESGYEFSGFIDDVRFYNRAITSAEIAQLYTMGGNKINKTEVTRAQFRNGLIGHWTFDAADLTSNTSTDRSTRENNGKRNTTTVAVGKIGQAIKFLPTLGDISSSSIIVASSADFTTGAAGTLSFSFWIKPNTLGGTFLSRKHYCANDGHFRLRMGTDGTVYFSFYSNLDTLGTTYGSAVPIISTGKWQYVTITKQWGTANAAKLYLNGVSQTFTNLDGSDTSQGTTYTDLVTVIGAEAAAGVCGADSLTGPKNNFFNGLMDDVRIYNRILAPAEVVELYKMGGGVISKSATVQPNLKNGLLGHWTFDGKMVTANTTTDSSGKGNDGFLLASLRPLFAVGKIGQGAKFDGSSRIIRIPTSSSLGVLGDTASVAFWVKSDNLTGAGAEQLVAYGNGSQYASGFMFYKTGRTLNVYWKAGGPISSLPNFFSTSTWVHIVMTNNNGTMNIYRDSVFYAGPGTTGGAITDATFNYFIGGEDSAGWFTRGILDDVRIYNRALTLVEIKQLYNMGK